MARPLVFLLLSACCLPVLSSCDFSKVPYLWRTYEHPTYRFQVKVPRTWEVVRDGLQGADVVFLASEQDPLFRANVNIVVQRRVEAKALSELIDISIKQFSVTLNQFEVLSRAPTKLGDLGAQELRGRYRGPEGKRILRSIVGVTQDMIYVATFTCREAREKDFQSTFEKIRRSFRIHRNLSEG